MLQNNTVVKIISLIIAILLWMYVMGEINPTTTTVVNNIPIKLLNENTLAQRDLTVSGDGKFSVDVEVKGKRSDINKLKKGKIKATADVFGYEKGENYVPVQVSVPDEVALIEVKTPKILIKLENLVSVYKPIDVEFTGETKAGTEAGDITVSPKEVEIKGAESAVNSIAEVQAKIKATKLTGEEQTFDVAPVPINKDGQPVYDVSLSARSAQVTASLYYTKPVDLEVKVTGEVPEDYEVEKMEVPKSVTVRGLKERVDAIKKLTADPVSISRVTASTTLPIKVNLPTGVELAAKSKDIGVLVTIKGLTTRTLDIPMKDSRIEGLSENGNAYINTDQISVTVSGKEELLKSITEDDFDVAVDVKGLKAGKHTVPVNITTDKKFSDMKIKPEEVEITIKEETESH